MEKYDELSDDQIEARIRRASLERGLDLLEGDKNLPPGQLISLISKLGLGENKVEDEVKKEEQDLFEVLPGLPAERRKEILDQFQAKLDEARKK